MNESRIFCSVIIFTLGIYTLFLLQYELFKLNSLTSSSNNAQFNSANSGIGKAGGGNSGGRGNGRKVNELKSVSDPEPVCNITIVKRPFTVNKLNCGSASEIILVEIQDCNDLPCDIIPDVNYNVSLQFKPSRNISSLEIETFVRQRKELKYLHKDRISYQALETALTTLKFAFTFPPHPVFKPKNYIKQKYRKCPPPTQLLYLLGVEIWDVASGIGEICLVIPIFLQF